MLRLFDGNNVFRRLLESDVTGQPLRMLLAEVEGYQQRGDQVIFCWDPPNAIQRRRKIVPHYKAGRPPMADDVRQSQELMKTLFAHAAVLQCEVPTYEADDVIAALARNAGPDVLIHSNDGDFLQLGVPTTADIALRKVPPELIRLHKAAVGDPSDNLKGIKGFGEKSWLGADHAALRLLIETPGTNPWPEQLQRQGLSKASAGWLVADGNLALVRADWEAAGFLDVEDHEIAAGFRHPIYDPKTVAEILNRFLQ